MTRNEDEDGKNKKQHASDGVLVNGKTMEQWDAEVREFMIAMEKRVSSEEFRNDVPGFTNSREAWEQVCDLVNRFSGVEGPTSFELVKKGYMKSRGVVFAEDEHVGDRGGDGTM